NVAERDLARRRAAIGGRQSGERCAKVVGVVLRLAIADVDDEVLLARADDRADISGAAAARKCVAGEGTRNGAGGSARGIASVVALDLARARVSAETGIVEIGLVHRERGLAAVALVAGLVERIDERLESRLVSRGQ